MSIVSIKQLYSDADAGGYALPAFSVLNTDALSGIMRAAEDLASPIILQMAQARFSAAPLETVGAAMLAAAERSALPIAVHLDHGLDIDAISRAMDMGFRSVMIDASAEKLSTNIERTAAVVHLARARGVAVEAEIGAMGAEGTVADEYCMSHPDDARRMYDEAAPDALAVAIGNVHGHYKREPQLDLSLLSEIRAAVPIPLVLHGGSGLSQEDIRACIERGIRKINIATALYAPALQCLQEQGARLPCTENGFMDAQLMLIDVVCQSARVAIEICMSKGRAS